MKALTIDPEYAYYIDQGEKTIECRTWKTKYRGEVLICASKTPVPGCICGHAYFTAILTDIEPFKPEHLEAAMMDEMPDVPCYAWHFENIWPIYPIPVRGMPGLFNVDDSLIKYIDDDIPEGMEGEELEKFLVDIHDKYFTPLVYSPAQL